MLEFVVGSAVVVAVATRTVRHRPRAPIRIRSTDPSLVVGADLPCPWCGGHTTESDRACFSCGQQFG